MLFTSEIFLFLFLPITLLVYFALGARDMRRAAIAWLVLASCVFYAWFRTDYLLLLVALILFNYMMGAGLARARQRGRSSRAALAFGIGVNLAVLGYYKYATFLATNANLWFGSSFVLEKIILPIGISFFIFQKIAYLVDAYRGQAEEYNLLDFSLFVMYFPQLVAGPIVHHKELIPQFRNASIFKVSYSDLAAGLVLFTMGLAKKILIADRVMVWADEAFAATNGADPTFFEAWAGALAFTFQIYFDFSAYSDMALGLALMIGIRLPTNFNSPYKATSIIDFWRRWHITLSRFLRDYVYFALGGNRHGKIRRYVNLMATMLLGGLWHGAAWTFVAWGGLHGGYLIVNHGWRAWKAKVRRQDSQHAIAIWSARILTFAAVVVAWVFFRAESFDAAIRMLAGMSGFNGVRISIAYQAHLGPLLSVAQSLGIGFEATTGIVPGLRKAMWLTLLLAWVWLLPNSQQLLAAHRPALEDAARVTWTQAMSRVGQKLGLLTNSGSIALNAATGAAAAMALMYMTIYAAMKATTLQKFIYFQF